MMRLLATGLCLLGLTGLADAQVRQSGNVTPRHAVCWTQTGVIQDCGTAASSVLTSIGTTGQGPTICANSAGNTAPYNQLCLSANTSSAAQIILQNFNGATAQTLQFLINGTVVSLPNPTTPLPVVSGGTGSSTPAGARTNLGLGTIATQDSNNITVTGGTIAGVTLSGSTITAPTITSPTVTGGTFTTPTLVSPSVSNLTLTSGTISGLPTCTTATEACPKSYIDLLAATGFVTMPPVRLATAAALPANTYANGASGVGATITCNANGALSIDGTLTVAGNSALIKNEVTTANNGVYTVTTVGDGSTQCLLTRRTDFDTAAEMLAGRLFSVTAGSTNIGNTYSLQNTVATVGTTPVLFNLLFLQYQPWVTSGADVTFTGGNATVSNNVNSDRALIVTNTNAGASASSALWLGNNNHAVYGGGLFKGSSAYNVYGGASSVNLMNFDNAPLALGTNNTVQATISGSGVMRLLTYGAGIANFGSTGIISSKPGYTTSIFYAADDGAVCDGSTNDTAHIQATITRAEANENNAGIVQLPGGECILDPQNTSTIATFTATVGGSVTGSIASTTLTVTAVASGLVSHGDAITGTGVTANTFVVDQLTGSTGGIGTYSVSISQTVSSTGLIATGQVMNVTAVASGTIALGQDLANGGFPGDTIVTGFITGSGGTGTYKINSRLQSGSTTVTSSIQAALILTKPLIFDGVGMGPGVDDYPGSGLAQTNGATSLQPSFSDYDVIRYVGLHGPTFRNFQIYSDTVRTSGGGIAAYSSYYNGNGVGGLMIDRVAMFKQWDGIYIDGPSIPHIRDASIVSWRNTGIKMVGHPAFETTAGNLTNNTLFNLDVIRGNWVDSAAVELHQGYLQATANVVIGGYRGIAVFGDTFPIGSVKINGGYLENNNESAIYAQGDDADIRGFQINNVEISCLCTVPGAGPITLNNNIGTNYLYDVNISNNVLFGGAGGAGNYWIGVLAGKNVMISGNVIESYAGTTSRGIINTATAVAPYFVLDNSFLATPGGSAFSPRYQLNTTTVVRDNSGDMVTADLGAWGEASWITVSNGRATNIGAGNYTVTAQPNSLVNVCRSEGTWIVGCIR